MRGHDDAVAGILTIHARATRYTEEALRMDAKEPPLLLRPGHAWLEYRATDFAATFSKLGDHFRRNKELGVHGEASREKVISKEQERKLFSAVARRAEAEDERGFNSCTSRLDSARFATLIW